ncbi:MAG TPA: sigma-54 dependent transcriptional regulator [Candidatus Limnocylindrales bacterium]|nr:sigma-54 dependent transcriptional regulator [Candidatus Limnocylindrales bacterium]
MADLLIVEDEEVLRMTLARNLRGRGHVTRTAESAEDALALIAEGPPDLILTDHRLPGRTGHDLLRTVKAEHPEIPVVLITAHGTVEDAVAAMRDGAADYLRKPVDLGELQLVVERCLRGEGLRRELEYYRTRHLADGEVEGILGGSPAVERLRALIQRVAGLQREGGVGPTVLLSGETGTGKGLVARAIHRASIRREAPLIEVNCTAIPEDLLEAELFGYERGAFTGAVAAKPGLLEAAEAGTMFFDEIGHMSLGLQAKLLKVIDERVVRRLGSTRDRPVRCSFVTATHMDLEKSVAEGRFRQDLYHRIHVVEVRLPPLRERGQDVALLAEVFLDRHAAAYALPRPRLTEAARSALARHTWPGNIRELSHTIERALVLAAADVIDEADLALPAGGNATAAAAAGRATAVPAGNRAAAGADSSWQASRRDGDAADRGSPSVDLAAGALRVDFSRGPIPFEELERELLQRALAHAGGSKTEAGRLLGMSRDMFRYRLAKYEA